METYRVVIKGETGAIYQVDAEMPDGSGEVAAAHHALQDLIAAQQQDGSSIPTAENFEPRHADAATIERLFPEWTGVDKLNPDALAETGEETGAPAEEIRKGVQPVDAVMIERYVIDSGELHVPESAKAFGVWLDRDWYDFNEDGDRTNGQVVAGGLAEWRGNVT